MTILRSLGSNPLNRIHGEASSNISSRPTCGWLAAVILICVSLGCQESTTPTQKEAGLTKVRLQLNWVPEAEHGGFYAANVYGFYKQAGIEVEIIPGGVSAPVLQQVAMDRVEFGVINSDWIILGRNDGVKVQALMAPIQNSPRCILVRPEVGAKTFADLKNLTLAASPNNAFLAFMQKKLPLENVQQVPYQSMQAFFANPKYAQQGYSFSEPYLARQQNIDPTVLMLSDLGFNPYTSCLVAGESLIQKDPALVRRFVQASIRGWERYLSDPVETNAKIAKLNPDQTPESLDFAIQEIRKLCQWEESVGRTKAPVGLMTVERFREMGQVLTEISFLKSGDSSVYEDSFTQEFLPELAQ